mmetsp:Transcript_43865/g.109872  ORF Transcript_43865/g.109872 Transcript_43865/m.109872 type:complete len:178 (+) Transcript_43865:43-576(+)
MATNRSPGSRSERPLLHLAGNRLFLAVPQDEKATLHMIEKYPTLFFFTNSYPESYGKIITGSVSGDFLCPFLIADFCADIRSRRDDPGLARNPLIFYAYRQDLFCAAVLLGAYLMLEEGMSPETAAKVFQGDLQLYAGRAFLVELAGCLKAIDERRRSRSFLHSIAEEVGGDLCRCH